MGEWKQAPDPEHVAAYRRIVEQLRQLSASNQVVLQRLRADLDIVMRNEEATRKLLAEEVYDVPAEWLDELLRLRMRELEDQG